MPAQNNYGSNLLSESTDIKTVSATLTATRDIFISVVQNLSSASSTKASAASVASQIEGVNSTINSNVSTINSNLASKANTRGLTTQINTVTTNLALKANSSDLTNQIATKQNLLTRNANAPGAPVIDSSNNIRNIFGDSPVDVSLFF